MAVIKLVEDYAVSQLRKDVRDSLMMAGEQCVVLQLYHPGDPDAVACPQCGDDVYNSPEKGCMSCYGTMFTGGVRQAVKVWSLFTDHQVGEELAKRGVYRPDQREIQFEAFPIVTEHDIVARVRGWGADGTPAVLEGFYMLAAITRRSLRTGNRFGQHTWDVVAQKAQLSELPGALHGITTYPILGRHFTEPVQMSTPSPTLGQNAVVAPDAKVVFFPVVAETPQVRPYATTIGDGAQTTITVYHNLGTEDVSVTGFMADTGAEVDLDVVHTDTQSITLNFQEAPERNSLRLVIQG